jgi:hypothetical protein
MCKERNRGHITNPFCSHKAYLDYYCTPASSSIFTVQIGIRLAHALQISEL